MVGKLVASIKTIGIEDVFLAMGAVLVSVGAAFQFDVPIGCMVGGALCLAYGKWMAKPIISDGGDE